MEQVNQVFKTNDLTIFKSIEGNRVPNIQHIKRLYDSILQNGMLCNPILVNESMQVIDGQHRLEASRKAKSFIYFVIIKGYNLKDVHVLNLNQKNWTKIDFLIGYADMGIESYKKLLYFHKANSDFNITDSIGMCSNTTGGNNFGQSSQRSKLKGSVTTSEIFEEGTWVGKDFDLAQLNANKLKELKHFYNGYNKSVFVGTMLGLFTNENFDFDIFISKLKLQPNALCDTASREQCRLLIEDIYNYRSRNKVNLRY